MSKSRYYPMGFDVRLKDERELEVFISGRNRWGLEQLIEAGSTGITSFQFAGVRIAAIIFDLKEMGVAINATTERHGGIFEGNHTRYSLDCFAQAKGARLL